MLVRRYHGAHMRNVAAWMVGLALVACGDVRYVEREPTAAEACEPTSGGEEGSADELSELMAEMIAPRICDRVLGSFIGLPGEETHDGAAGGRDPSVGRWWIRRCEARVEGGRLQVVFGGPGWTWLDRESTGFRVRQYLRFDAAASFTASLHLGYDGRTRIASVWLRPQPGVRAVIQPTGLVQAEATSVFSSMLGGLLSMAGESASDRARTQAASEGSDRLSERLQAGFTVTYQLDSEQMDFMLGQLPRGVTPERPWDAGGVTWIVNERSTVWPGGVDVVGPIPEDAGQVTFDAELEEGGTTVIRRVCADRMHRWFDAAWAGREPAALTAPTVATLTATGAPTSIDLAPMGCPTLLVVTLQDGARVPSTLRYRVVSRAARASSGGEASASPSQAATAQPTARPPRAFRLQIRSLLIEAQDPDGDDWDVVGGDPDPYVVITSVRQGRELHRTPVVEDSREPRFDQWLPSAVAMSALPVRLVVYDDDVGGDEVIGVALIEASNLEAGEADLTLDLHARGGSGRRSGVIRLRVQPER